MKHFSTQTLVRNILPVLLIVTSIISCDQTAQQTQKAEDQNNKTGIPATVSKEMPIWPKAVPDSELIKGTETYNDGMLSDVSHPTITIFSPKEKNTGAAVIVFPGGGYAKLAIDLEGS